MNKSMVKLFGKTVVEKGWESGEWPGILFIYGSALDNNVGKERAMALRGSRIFRREVEIGLPLDCLLNDFKIVKPTEKQCRNFIINAFNMVPSTNG